LVPGRFLSFSSPFTGSVKIIAMGPERAPFLVPGRILGFLVSVYRFGKDNHKGSRGLFFCAAERCPVFCPERFLFVAGESISPLFRSPGGFFGTDLRKFRKKFDFFRKRG
jgi:hypothetical protein